MAMNASTSVWKKIVTYATNMPPRFAPTYDARWLLPTKEIDDEASKPLS
jgi:hypothetical protein